MFGIDVNQTIAYKHASFRYFNPNEHHITRFCEYNVLLLVFAGVLRFSEDGVPYELQPCEYFIQKHGTEHTGELPSDSPKYLYVHFSGEWTENEHCLPFRGNFSYLKSKPLMEKMHFVSHRKESYVVQKAVFYSLLSELFESQKKKTVADEIAEYLIMHYNKDISLTALCSRFSYSKNYVISLFKEKYGITPFAYLLSVRLENAKNLLLTSSQSAESVAFDSGFSDYSHFYKAFKKATALSPSHWKKQHCAGVLSAEP
jgi:AraC-like DNA-binding protein